MRAHEEDRIYYQQREQHCREMAEKAADPAVQQIHHQFAEAYARRLRAEAVRPASMESMQSSAR
jgi:hypothetical protein